MQTHLSQVLELVLAAELVVQAILEETVLLAVLVVVALVVVGMEAPVLQVKVMPVV